MLKGRGVAAISGPFSFPQPGHFEYIHKSREYIGDQWELVAIMNNSHWVIKKYGFEPIPEYVRKAYLLALGVDRVIITEHKPDDDDISVSRELRELRPNIFLKGGDRLKGEIPEGAVCEEFGIKIIDGMGDKIDSSSKQIEGLIRRYAESRGVHIPEEKLKISLR